MAEPERWSLTHDGVKHTIHVEDEGWGRRITWTTEGVETKSEKSANDRIVLDGGEQGAIALVMPAFGGPARRVTWWGADSEMGAVAAGHSRIGGIDFDPEPGSKAAQREAWIRAHPRRYAMRRAAIAVAKVGVPLLLVWLFVRYILPRISWPDWDIPRPSIPWPDWDIPWPSIPWPSIPWPDWRINIPWSMPELPGWVVVILDNMQYVVPVLLALLLARAEIKRRRVQDERKRAAQAKTSDDDSGGGRSDSTEDPPAD